MEEKTIDEKRFTLTWKVAIPVVASLLIISNTFTLQIERVSKNAEDNIRIEAEGIKERKRLDDANRRRLKNSEEKTALKNEIIFYKYKLEVCEKK